jgi:hypothetical protein
MSEPLTPEERLAQIEVELFQLIKKVDELLDIWQRLEMAKRQANLMEVDAQERALSIRPSTSDARKQLKEARRAPGTQ